MDKTLLYALAQSVESPTAFLSFVVISLLSVDLEYTRADTMGRSDIETDSGSIRTVLHNILFAFACLAYRIGNGVLFLLS